MRSAVSTVAVLFAAAGLSSAQNLTIDPSTVPIGDRNQWCLSQKTQCPLICLQTAGNTAKTESNTCDTSTLQYSCVCSNGQSPNISEYSQTMPYFICTENNNRCVTACGQNNQCSSDCRTDNLCGAQNPTRVNATTSSASATAAATSSGAANYGSFGSDGSSGKSGANTLAVDMGARYGLAVLVSGLVAGAALIL